MTDLLDNWQPETKAQEAETVLDFITRYVEIHRKPPALRACCDGTKLNEYRVQRAVARLRRQNRLSQSSLRPVQKATLNRWYKQRDGSNVDAD
jgi:hypothetical protein